MRTREKGKNERKNADGQFAFSGAYPFDKD